MSAQVQPGTVPEWCTNGTNKVPPPADKTAVGYGSGEKPAAEQLNDRLYWIWQWILYLKNLNNVVFTWLQAHTFQAAVTFQALVTSALGIILTPLNADPTTGLATGYLYINSVSKLVRAYVGSVWLSLTPANMASITSYNGNASYGSTSVTGGWTIWPGTVVPSGQAVTVAGDIAANNATGGGTNSNSFTMPTAGTYEFEFVGDVQIQTGTGVLDSNYFLQFAATAPTGGTYTSSFTFAFHAVGYRQVVCKQTLTVAANDTVGLYITGPTAQTLYVGTYTITARRIA